jgi:hypothetical protein
MTTPDLSQLESMLGEMPGGSYIMSMLRNNPAAMDALSQIDPNDPASMQRSMRVLLGLFGMQGPQADAMIGQMMSMMDDPDAMSKMNDMMASVPDPGDAPTADADAGPAATIVDGAPDNVVAFPGSAPAPSAGTAGPVWQGAMGQLEMWLEEGNLRKAFERFHTILDHPTVAEWNPENSDTEELVDLMALYVKASNEEGRQIPLRFNELFRRLAMVRRPADFQPPTQNPEFSAWCLSLVESLV